MTRWPLSWTLVSRNFNPEAEVTCSISPFVHGSASVKLLLFVPRQCAQVTDWKSFKSIYEFSAKDIDGNEVSLEKYRYIMSHGNIFFSITPAVLLK